MLGATMSRAGACLSRSLQFWDDCILRCCLLGCWAQKGTYCIIKCLDNSKKCLQPFQIRQRNNQATSGTLGKQAAVRHVNVKGWYCKCLGWVGVSDGCSGTWLSASLQSLSSLDSITGHSHVTVSPPAVLPGEWVTDWIWPSITGLPAFCHADNVHLINCLPPQLLDNNVILFGALVVVVSVLWALHFYRLPEGVSCCGYLWLFADRMEHYFGISFSPPPKKQQRLFFLFSPLQWMGKALFAGCSAVPESSFIKATR